MKVLAVEAHPDDAEIICAGTLARLAAMGHDVSILSITAGDLGTNGDSVEATIRTRTEEARRAAAVISARFFCAGIADKHVFFTEENRNRVTEIFRRLTPELLFIPSPKDYVLDHEFTSLLARDAATAASAALFQTGAYDAAPATHGIPSLYYCDPVGRIDIFGNPVLATTYVDISDSLETKVKMYNCHASQVDFLRQRHKQDYVREIRTWAADAGKLAGFSGAEGFRQHLAPPFPKNNVLVELLGARLIQDTLKRPAISQE